MHVSNEFYPNNINYIELMKEEINNIALAQKNRINDKDFTRKRKLPFNRIIGMIMNKIEHAIPMRIDYSFDKLCPEDLEEWPTPSAFVQARKKVDAAVFIDLMNFSNEEFYKNEENRYEIKKWRDHILLSVDGSRIDIPESPDNELLFSRMRARFNQNGTLQGSINCLYDSLNKLALNINLGKVQAEKIPLFKDHIPFLESGPLAKYLSDPILIFDRLYIDYSVFAMLDAHNFKFCIRSKTSCTFKVITDFVKSDKTDEILTFKVTPSQNKFVSKHNLATVIKLRAVKVILPTGELEILITNLLDMEKYPSDCFQELYFMRWWVEVGFHFLKIFMELQKFTSKKLQFILQDFYAKFFVLNFCEMLKKEEDQKLKVKFKDSGRKWEYQISIANLITTVNANMMELMIMQNFDTKILYKRISKWIHTQLSPIRPNRSFKRKKLSDSKRLVHQIVKKRHHS